MAQAKEQRILKVGAKVFIRTVTHYYTGEITLITSDAIVLKDAAWVADTERFGLTLSTGKLNEVEPYPDGVEVARGSIVDVCRWNHALPREAL